MASAYLAVQDSLGRQVVLKVLDTTKVDSPESVERFLNEGRLVAALNHPHIITIYDIGITEDAIYISMEYVEGGDLKQRMSRYRDPEQALDLINRIGNALEAAHRKGIVHRDVKPANILFRKNGTPLLTDFGIAKKLVSDHEITSTGIFLGSPNYMAPEQAEGGGIDGRADIYSLGVILYEMLTGEKPYQSSSVIDVLMQHKQAPIPKLPEGLEQYQELLELMMAKQRSDRFKDAASMLHYLDKLKHTDGMRKQAVHISHAPEIIDSTGQHFRISDITAEMQQLKEQSATHEKNLKKSRRNLYILIALLLLVGSGFGGLMYYETLIGGSSGSNISPPVSAAQPAPSPSVQPAPAVAMTQQPAVPVPEQPAVQPGIAPAEQAAPKQAAEPPRSTGEVVTALQWLAKHSLEQYKLTYPPRDNAYYYYTRLLEMDPENPVARRGILEVAERFAFLAEKELASNNREKAMQYISVGLQIDPGNKALNTLNSLSRHQDTGFLQRLIAIFR